MSDIEECYICNKTKCPKECFNHHPGSLVALQKLFDESGKNVYIAGQNKEVDVVKEK